MAVTSIDEHVALVLIDLQAGTTTGEKQPYSGDDVIARSVELADAFRAAGAPVFLVRNVFSADGGDAVPGRSELAGGPIPAYDLGDIVEPLQGHDSDIVVTKRNWGAFVGTDLDLQLRRRGITQIVLGGVATSIGVESAARGAYDHGYGVVLATDAMTDMNGDAHQHSVGWIFRMLGETATTAEVLDLLAKRA